VGEESSSGLVPSPQEQQAAGVKKSIILPLTLSVVQESYLSPKETWTPSKIVRGGPHQAKNNNMIAV
jgi:hypothetical protein